MKLRVTLQEHLPDGVEAVGHLVFEPLEPAEAALSLDAGESERRRFAGKLGESLVTPAGGVLEVLVGLGRRDELTSRSLRRAAAAFARAAQRCSTAALVLPEGLTGAVGGDRAVQAAVEGAAGAAYQFTRYRSGNEPDNLGQLSLVVPATAGGEEGLRRGLATASAVSMARDLGNTPAGDLSPAQLADVASEVAARAGLAVEILGQAEIEAERLGGLLGVARGSAQPPRLIKLVYEPVARPEGTPAGTDVPTVVLVGKGITFDSGGLSLKSGEGMKTMKTDMSGAAAVIAVLGACGELGVACRVVGLAPTTENMPGGRATKPGDVLTIRNGKTIEVLNTDAEGRLVLADGLSLATEMEPDSILDVATLTGACVVALGSKVAGVMGNDSRVLRALERAAERAGEAVWHLPLPRAYRSDVDSEVADMRNIGRPMNAGALVAGLILEEFVGDRPWAHLDIAGPSRSEDDVFDLRKGSTGFGVRTLLEYLASYEPLGSPADHAADGAVR